MYRLILWWQRLLLWASYTWHGLALKRSRKGGITWVVGPHEIASMVTQIASVIPNSYSVTFEQHRSYASSATYDYTLSAAPGTTRHARQRKFFGPLLLGRLAHQAQGIIYVGGTGFLVSYDDGRDYEMRWAKRHGLKAVCYWTGSDIRSLPRMKELEATLNRPNVATYIDLVVPGLGSDEAEAARRKLTAACDKWADATYNNSVDHLSDLQSATEPFLYFLPDNRLGDLSQFDDVTHPVLVHATTSPIIKGTQLVRAAIAKLRAEGYEFEYVELMGVPNDAVVAQLRRSHIALNQFYGFSPAVFGVESLCAGTVVMMSADETLEPDLPPGSNDAWVVTSHWEVYDNLKRLLDAPASWKPIAQRALDWASEYGTATGAGARLNKVLDAVLAGTYEPPTLP